MPQFKNLKDLLTKFQDEQVCRDFLVQHRWNGVPVCPYCGATKSYKIENGKRFKCANKECHKKYSVTVGTVAEDSNIVLSTWFAAIYIVASHKKGINSIQFGKDLGIAQKTAWFVLHRIREAMKGGNSPLLVREVETDETYIGGSNKNRHEGKKHYDVDGKLVDYKVPAMGVIEPGGEVMTMAVTAATKKNAIKFLEANLSKKTENFVTDGSTIYAKIGKKYNHIVVNHAAGIYRFEGHTTNHMENYWSVLKRGIYGIYHQVSPKYLQEYCNEFAYRFNSRKIADNDRFELTLQRLTGRLTYAQLTAKPVQNNSIEAIETGE